MLCCGQDGTELPVDTPGLLQCRGIGLMKEYWNNRQATLDNIDNDGWLDTGDIARIDEEGYLYIMVSTTACQTDPLAGLRSHTAGTVPGLRSHVFSPMALCGQQDRAKDLIIRGGENISCAEVEAAIFANDPARRSNFTTKATVQLLYSGPDAHYYCRLVARSAPLPRSPMR